jgi:hypothetical protein
MDSVRILEHRLSVSQIETGLRMHLHWQNALQDAGFKSLTLRPVDASHHRTVPKLLCLRLFISHRCDTKPEVLVILRKRAIAGLMGRQRDEFLAILTVEETRRDYVLFILFLISQRASTDVAVFKDFFVHQQILTH